MPENLDNPSSAPRRPSRRSSLLCGISALTAFAGLPATVTAVQPGRHARPRSCILLWLDGGPLLRADQEGPDAVTHGPCRTV